MEHATMRGAQPWQTESSRILRSKATHAEMLFWQHVRDRRAGAFKIVRQSPIGGYFADFHCKEARLVIELDGETHDSEQRKSADDLRTRQLQILSYQGDSAH